MADLMDLGFWRELNPQLHASDADFINAQGYLAINDTTLDNIYALFRREGYIQVPPLDWGLPIAGMAQGIANLRGAGLTPPFAFIYDEFWTIYSRLHLLLNRLLGGSYYAMPDFWAWYVDPQKGESGWKPHRDKSSMSLFPDGTPKSLTIWLPLTDATTLNGCMYIVPADRDPTYGTEADKEWKFGFPDIRALPAAAGSLLAWNQAVLHWGSRSSVRGGNPRISIAMEFQRADIPAFNSPLLHPLSIPTHQQRLSLVFKQLLQYKHMYPLSDDMRELAERGLREFPLVAA